MSLTQASFNHQTRMAALAVKQLIRLQGMKCGIYFPDTTTETLYNDASQNYVYKSSADEEGNYLVTGIYDASPLTGLESEFYNTFTDSEAFMYTVGENLEFPRNSKVEIWYNGSMKVMRIQDTNIVEGLNGKPVYGIIQLVPII